MADDGGPLMRIWSMVGVVAGFVTILALLWGLAAREHESIRETLRVQRDVILEHILEHPRGPD